MVTALDDPAVAAVQALYDRLQAEQVEPDAAINALLSAVAGLIVTGSANAIELNSLTFRARITLQAKIDGSVALGLLGAGLKGGGDARPLTKRHLRAMRERWRRDLARLEASFPRLEKLPENFDSEAETIRNLATAIAEIDGIIIAAPSLARRHKGGGDAG